ncbi:Lipin/Ned1/Smp2-domain-containing protein [Kockovaella imperatae]|uniref:phosphatidate phosphatase n=1 Tax=Kockovaella imperatae TaxID=4999 RepID=A0A1Y1UTN2_9TREE|nr:Lipin/Ned1/Smp2-domain-containing protein [Kockovaella imperatae]ORX40786.1 Lipin/Ned1/Smp2-domain-containing protein [Kockovaella imperatae]
MQYLSKAYSFYSGINPATLSGAIDVIVVKHVDEDGEVTLSSSPFHVRFGKLQVLRAAEKRVTLRLPNNLPPPHVAPFSMKVGESGEAFFVLETDEDVPEDLLTSPVVSPTDDIPPTPPFSSTSQTSAETLPLSEPRTDTGKGPKPEIGQHEEPVHVGSLTQNPFGETEEQVNHTLHSDRNELGDVEPLDLDQPDPVKYSTPSKSSLNIDKGSSTASPSSILNAPASLLPSFLTSSKSSNKEPETDETAESLAKSRGKAVLSKTTPPENPENPVSAKPGEDAKHVDRNQTISTYKKTHDIEHALDPGSVPADDLPKVDPGEGEGPDVVYGKDVVLDMSGYHSAGKATEERNPKAERGMAEEAYRVKSALTAAKIMEGKTHSSKVRASLIEAFAHDLMASVPSHSYSTSSRRNTPRSDETSAHSGLDNMDRNDDRPSHSQSDLSSTLDSLSLEEATPMNKSSALRRGDRGQSEPPPDMEDDLETSMPSSSLARPPNGNIFPYSSAQPPRPTTPTNLPNTWDWARMPPQSPESGGVDDLASYPDTERIEQGASGRNDKERLRADSMPAFGLDLPLTPPGTSRDPSSSAPGRLKNVEESPYLFVLEMEEGRSYTFELALCEKEDFASNGKASDEEESAFLQNRITFQRFIEEAQLVDDPRLVLRYSLQYLTWSTGSKLLSALSMYRRSLTPSGMTPPGLTAASRPSGSSWSKWWRRGQQSAEPSRPGSTAPASHITESIPTTKSAEVPTRSEPARDTQYAKTLRLSSDQLKSLNLKPGPNTVHFSVTSSYSGLATCTARIFLWENTDQIVISDIDGTITKSDALGHVFAAIGRDWTHLGIAKLYTDIANNGYKILYLTSRAIGQADSTREYLKSIVQNEYRLPEGPVIMSPDRLMASLHREVIMRKPEMFKMACLRDIQRLFGHRSKDSFFAGFGNRITDAMSYRSVGIEASKIYTIDSTGVVKTELLQAAGHKGSYMGLNDLVNETFPPVKTKVKPEFTDFNWWRSSIPDVQLPDLTPVPVSPALSARSASSTTSSRYNVLGRISQTIGRKSSRPILPSNLDDTKSLSSRPSSPLMGPALTSDELSDTEEYGEHRVRPRQNSMPGSFDDTGEHFSEFVSSEQKAEEGRGSVFAGSIEHSEEERFDDERVEDDSFDDGAIFDDDILAAGEMKNVPF